MFPCPLTWTSAVSPVALSLHLSLSVLEVYHFWQDQPEISHAVSWTVVAVEMESLWNAGNMLSVGCLHGTWRWIEGRDWSKHCCVRAGMSVTARKLLVRDNSTTYPWCIPGRIASCCSVEICIISVVRVGCKHMWIRLLLLSPTMRSYRFRWIAHRTHRLLARSRWIIGMLSVVNYQRRSNSFAWWCRIPREWSWRVLEIPWIIVCFSISWLFPMLCFWWFWSGLMEIIFKDSELLLSFFQGFNFLEIVSYALNRYSLVIFPVLSSCYCLSYIPNHSTFPTVCLPSSLSLSTIVLQCSGCPATSCLAYAFASSADPSFCSDNTWLRGRVMDST